MKKSILVWKQYIFFMSITLLGEPFYSRIFFYTLPNLESIRIFLFYAERNTVKAAAQKLPNYLICLTHER